MIHLAADFISAKAGMNLATGVIKRKLAICDQHPSGQAGCRLGHGMQTDYRILRHR